MGLACLHHAAMRRWFESSAAADWATCPLTESGFVRVSSNPRVLTVAVTVATAREAVAHLRAAPGHEFLTDDVSLADADVPPTMATGRSPTCTS